MNAIEVLSSLAPIEMDAGIVFSGKASGTNIKGYAQPCAYTPKADPNYIFHSSVRDVIVWLLNPVEPLYIYGPLGCGKSSQIRQIAARLNYPVFEITGHGRLEFADLVGHLTVIKNSMAFEYGPLRWQCAMAAYSCSMKLTSLLQMWRQRSMAFWKERHCA